ncbi:unnamed protein product [Sphagnum jensenii]|jgi:hypothetical protein|uniref:Uncharacterized protein n=1 Tax=Sphagnum jensenii TaxID=128206 RepID=A0ABP0XD37_9BRYO
MEFSLQYGDPGTNSRSSENGSSRGNFGIGKPHWKVVDSDTLVGALVCEEDEEKGVAIGDETTSGFVVVTTTKTTRTRESVTAIAPPKNARDRTQRERETIPPVSPGGKHRVARHNITPVFFPSVNPNPA